MSREISASSAWGNMHFSELNLVLSDQSDSKSTGCQKEISRERQYANLQVLLSFL